MSYVVFEFDEQFNIDVWGAGNTRLAAEQVAYCTMRGWAMSSFESLPEHIIHNVQLPEVVEFTGQRLFSTLYVLEATNAALDALEHGWSSAPVCIDRRGDDTFVIDARRVKQYDVIIVPVGTILYADEPGVGRVRVVTETPIYIKPTDIDCQTVDLYQLEP